ncbi:MAG TPA: hydrogenase iron-sulfur subunit [Syntrophaceae bacterium]|nr:hydrogenase iron-sulfur subunit [Syntrophaceae bacterium]
MTQNRPDSFEPKILGFLCNWCCYAAADSAGVGRLQYPPNIRVIRVMCSGRIDPAFIFEAFCHRADGVFIGGCQLGDCHYQFGNFEAMATMGLAWKVMEQCGVDSQRLALEWASAAEAPLFAQLVARFTERIKELGPLGSSEGKDWEELRFKLEAARQVTRGTKLRMAFGKLAKEIRKGGAYRSELIEEGIEKNLGGIIRTEINRSEIVFYIREKGPLSSQELSVKMGIPHTQIEDELAGLSKKGLVERKDGIWAMCEVAPVHRNKP